MAHRLARIASGGPRRAGTTIRALAACALALVAFAGCTLPRLSDVPGLRPAKLRRPLEPVAAPPPVLQPLVVPLQRELEIGAREARAVEEEIGLFEHRPLLEYVRSIGERLGAVALRRDVEYAFHVLDVPEAIAFALPGGYVYLSRGLIALANSEDEVAGVIGHQIAHVVARHSVQRQTFALPYALATSLPAAETGRLLPQLGRGAPHGVDGVDAIGRVASGLVLGPYSPEQEWEADRMAQELMAAAGWEPAALASVLRTLEREAARLEAEARAPAGFLASHPSAPGRFEVALERASALGPVRRRALAPDGDAFLERLEGLRVGVNPSFGQVVRGRFAHPLLRFGVTFPQGWSVHPTRAFVSARRPQGGAAVGIGVLEDTSDPMRAAQRLAEQQQLRYARAPAWIRVGGLDAVRALAREKGQWLDLIWIAYRGRVFQLTGVARASLYPELAPSFRAVAQSFAPLRVQERASIRDLRLRLWQAFEGERLDRVLQRTRSAWGLDRLAVANGVRPDQLLSSEQILKVAVSEPYRSGR